MYPNWILQRARLTPDRIALTFEDTTFTFKQIKVISVKRAQQLAAFGLKKHSRVAVLGPNEPDLIFMMYACMHLQCEMVMLNRKLSRDELDYQIKDSHCQIVLVSDEDTHLLYDDTPRLLFSQIEQAAPKHIEIEEEWDANETTSIMYTSGTTGFPKGVRQTVGNHQTNALSSVLNIGLSEEDVWLCAVPIFHISGFSILVRSLLYGNEVKLYRKFESKAVVQDITTGRVTFMSVVAVMLERVIDGLENEELDASPQFKLMLAGGGPVPEKYLERAKELRLGVAQTYGMTETSSQTATLSNEDAFRKIGSAGKPLFFNQIKIANTDIPYAEGEICIRGPHVTPGYIGRYIDQSSTIDGWLHTGDIGYLDDEGYLYVVDRRSDLIISGGENVYPAQIENILLSHPAIQEAGVCGMEDQSWGQVPVAFVILKQDISKEEIIAYCREKLATFKVPKDIHFVQMLPRNGSNKLMRRKLLELLK